MIKNPNEGPGFLNQVPISSAPYFVISERGEKRPRVEGLRIQ